MRMNRHSYSSILSMPGWVLLDKNKNLVATVRAPDADTARRIFKENRFDGVYLRQLGPPLDICTCGHKRIFHRVVDQLCSLCKHDPLLCGGFQLKGDPECEPRDRWPLPRR